VWRHVQGPESLTIVLAEHGFFTEPNPARPAVGCQLYGAALVEIEAIALMPS